MADSSQRREESVRVSLRELMKLEEERLARERADRAAVAAEAERRRAQAEEEARARTEEVRLREEREERARRDDEARREALVKFSVEQARIEVEARTRAEEIERRRRHERELAAEAQRGAPASAPWTRALAGFAGGLLLSALVACAILGGGVLPAHEAELRAVRDAVATLEARVSDLGIARDQAVRDAVEWRGRAEAAQRALDARSAAPEPKSATPRSVEPSRPNHRHRSGAGPASPGATCLSGDPMCFTVGDR